LLPAKFGQIDHEISVSDNFEIHHHDICNDDLMDSGPNLYTISARPMDFLCGLFDEIHFTNKAIHTNTYIHWKNEL